MRDISQSQWVDCDSTRRYVGLNLSQHPVLIFVGGIPSIAAFVCVTHRLTLSSSLSPLHATSMRHRCCPSSSTALRLSSRRFI